MNERLFLLTLFCLLAQQLNGQDTSSADSLKITEINIQGNFITSKKFIFRELVFKIDEYVKKKDIEYIRQTSINNLTKSTLFNFIDVQAVEIDGGKLAIYVNLTERWFIWPDIYLNQTDRNFSEWWRNKDLSKLEYGIGLKVNNFRGMGESLQVKYHIGSLTRREFEYKGIHLDKAEHHFLDIHTTFVDLKDVPWMVRSNQQVILKSEKKLLRSSVFDIQYTYRKKYFNFHSIDIGYSIFRAADTILKLNPYFFGQNNTSQRYFSIGYTFTRDTRDSHFYPKTGYLLIAGINKKGLGIFPGEYNSIDFYFQDFDYRRLTDRIYFASGFLYTSASKSGYAYYPQTGLGYMQFVRGYEYYVADGDKSLLLKSLFNFKILPMKILNLNFWPFRKAYQFNKIPLEIYSNVFFDAGYVYDKTEEYKLYNNNLVNKIMYGTGIGIDIITYYDKILRIDYAFNGFGEHGFFILWKAPIL